MVVRARQAKKPKSAAVPKARLVTKARRGWQRYLPRGQDLQARFSLCYDTELFVL